MFGRDEERAVRGGLCGEMERAVSSCDLPS